MPDAETSPGGKEVTSSFSSGARVISASPGWAISTRTLPVWGTHCLPVIITRTTAARAAAVSIGNLPGARLPLHTVNLPFVWSLALRPVLGSILRPVSCTWKWTQGSEWPSLRSQIWAEIDTPQDRARAPSLQAELRFELKSAIPVLQNSVHNSSFTLSWICPPGPLKILLFPSSPHCPSEIGGHAGSIPNLLFQVKTAATPAADPQSPCFPAATTQFREIPLRGAITPCATKPTQTRAENSYPLWLQTQDAWWPQAGLVTKFVGPSAKWKCKVHCLEVIKKTAGQ